MSKIQNTEEVNVSGTTEDLTNTPETQVVTPTEGEEEFTPVGELPKADEVVPTAPVVPEVAAPKAGKEQKAPKTPTASKSEKSDLVKIKFKIDVGYKAKKHSAGDEAEFTEAELEDFMPTWYIVL